MNFIGRYYHALEQKGRIAIPATFRKDLGLTAIITRGLEGCLFLFPKDSWQKTISSVSIHPFTDRDIREWTRLLIHNAQEVALDSQGRILIHEHLKDFAKLSSDCVIAGSIDYIEIWDKSIYHAYMDNLENRAEEIAQKVSQKELNGQHTS